MTISSFANFILELGTVLPYVYMMITREFAGSFAQLPHEIKSGETIKTSLSLCIAELLEDLEAEDDESVLVILVPRAGTDDLTIDSINIEYQSA
ncbi:hypothetical protein LguiB_029946 [Lonicera macranthoides]